MTDATFASLSPTLLARKGGAKPAMRPQSGMVGPVDGREAAANLEDLGWNDMGDDASAQESGEVVSLPARRGGETRAPNQVRESIDRIAAQLERQPDARPALRAAPARPRRRAAFTLRLDNERHLKLRLACTVRNRSAQQLVTDALDALLAEMPEVEMLAAQLQRDDN